MKIKNVIILLIILFVSRSVYADSAFNLLQITCGGELATSKAEGLEHVAVKLPIGNVQSGMLYGGILYTIKDSVEVIATNLNSKENIPLVDLRTLGNNLTPWGIGGINKDRIFFNACYSSPNLPISKQKHYYYIYQFDFDTNKICHLPEITSFDSVFSCYGNRIYYVGEKGEIYQYERSIGSNALDIKGRSPTVSPNGSKLAYASFGIIRDGVFVYDLETGNNTQIIKFFLKKAYPVIRWSNDSKLIAVYGYSDISLMSLYVIDISTKKIIKQFPKNNACNWFFLEP